MYTTLYPDTRALGRSPGARLQSHFERSCVYMKTPRKSIRACCARQGETGAKSVAGSHRSASCALHREVLTFPCALFSFEPRTAWPPFAKRHSLIMLSARVPTSRVNVAGVSGQPRLTGLSSLSFFERFLTFEEQTPTSSRLHLFGIYRRILPCGPDSTRFCEYSFSGSIDRTAETHWPLGKQAFEGVLFNSVCCFGKEADVARCCTEGSEWYSVQGRPDNVANYFFENYRRTMWRYIEEN